MDPATLITTLAVSGAAAIGKDILSEATKDGYKTLMQLLGRKLDDSAVGKTALANIEKDPEGWKAPLKQAIVEVGADQDQQLLDLAKRLMSDMEPQLAAVGKNNVQVSGGQAQGFIVGDDATMTNTFTDNT